MSPRKKRPGTVVAKIGSHMGETFKMHVFTCIWGGKKLGSTVFTKLGEQTHQYICTCILLATFEHSHTMQQCPFSCQSNYISSKAHLFGSLQIDSRVPPCFLFGFFRWFSSQSTSFMSPTIPTPHEQCPCKNPIKNPGRGSEGAQKIHFHASSAARRWSVKGAVKGAVFISRKRGGNGFKKK